MTDIEFKSIADRNKNDNLNLCYEYYVDEGKEKGYKIIDKRQFDSDFQMWLMLINMGDTTSGLLNGILYLKNKHNYK